MIGLPVTRVNSQIVRGAGHGQAADTDADWGT